MDILKALEPTSIFSGFDLLSIGLAVAATGILGFVVFLNNRRNITNQSFFLFTLFTILWGIVNYLSYQFNVAGLVIWILRIAIFFAVWHTFSFFTFCFAYPQDKVVYDSTLLIWYGRYFRKKIESGEIKSVCLVRSGYLGDVIMTEPAARFLLKYVPKVYLATEIEGAELIFAAYDKVYKYSQVNSGEIDCDMMIKLVYELSDNKKTYIQGYMESIGFGEVVIKDIPILNSDWENIIDGEYVLIAPFTSRWEEKKRNWGYEKFIELSRLIETEYNVKCVILEKYYSFTEMMSLIKHCKFLIGNDSAPVIIAQSFKKKVFIIFGATRPDYLHILECAVSIYDKNRHKLCRHNSRKEELDCCEEFCMERITVGQVFDRIKSHV